MEPRMPTQKRFHESEEDTKLRRITPAIQRAGWKADQILMEYSLKADRYRIVPGQNCTIKETQASRTKPDYILCRGINRPLAVVEETFTISFVPGRVMYAYLNTD